MKSSLKPLTHAEQERLEFLIKGAELGHAETLDLHGQAIDDALRQLDRFVHQEIMERTEVIRIVYGLGTGKLREAILRWLKNNRKLVPYFRESTNLHEGGAVAYATLIRIFKR